MLTFSLAASLSRLRRIRKRVFNKTFCSIPSRKLGGGESTLTDFLTRWQKGRRNHPFRQANIKIISFECLNAAARRRLH